MTLKSLFWGFVFTILLFLAIAIAGSQVNVYGQTMKYTFPDGSIQSIECNGVRCRVELELTKASSIDRLLSTIKASHFDADSAKIISSSTGRKLAMWRHEGGYSVKASDADTSTTFPNITEMRKHLKALLKEE